ncbi:MAG: SDR family oxidoreductase [Deltaproteobacteria bacterium]|nr:SDR family oxidoreductase [Deltaproteobacteria bacterium]
MNKEQKSIFITGAASGIGRATARLFAKHGWYIGLNDLNEQGLEALAAEIGLENCQVTKLDVGNRSDYQAALKAFGDKTGGKMDLLFNNAGIGKGTLFGDTDFADLEAMVKTNLMGVIIGIHAAYPMLKNTPNSLCFTTSSSSAIIGVPGLATYSATKHAIKGLTEALSVEFSLFDIRAADTLPGQIDTAMMLSEMKEMAPEKGMWRLVPAEAVADVVWKSYHDKSGKLHWYVPEELEKLEKIVSADIESARDGSMKMFAGKMSGVLQQQGK